jgi:NAD+ synthase
VKQLALHIVVPPEIAEKPPSPRLWPNQLAEKELRITYETLDVILFGLEQSMKPKETAEQLNISAKLVEIIKRRWQAMGHKRQMPSTISSKRLKDGCTL